jgi:hypothetical protein
MNFGIATFNAFDCNLTNDSVVFFCENDQPFRLEKTEIKFLLNAWDANKGNTLQCEVRLGYSDDTVTLNIPHKVMGRLVSQIELPLRIGGAR